MKRSLLQYDGDTPKTNEPSSAFKYTRLKGLDYNGGDGTVSRRAPSKIIFANGKYYVWYTRRSTPTPPQGAELPSFNFISLGLIVAIGRLPFPREGFYNSIEFYPAYVPKQESISRVLLLALNIISPTRKRVIA